MSFRPSARVVTTLALASLIAVGCGGAATTAASATAAPTAPNTAASATSATAVAAGSWIVSDKSRATLRVREQLARVSFPSDAVLVASGAVGSFQLKDDGAFTADSKISFDLNTLTSDQRDRDNFVKQDTLRVRQFPRAELVPTKASGSAPPLQASGQFTFTLAGKITIHGVQRDVTFDVQAKRDGADLVATATANPTWKFGDFGMSVPSLPFRVLSVVDEIRLVVDLVATLPNA